MCKQVKKRSEIEEFQEEEEILLNTTLCCNYYCEKGYLTIIDQLLIETGFNIYIFFSYLADAVDPGAEWINEDY